jgi:hypothetical protein
MDLNQFKKKHWMACLLLHNEFTGNASNDDDDTMTECNLPVPGLFWISVY